MAFFKKIRATQKRRNHAKAMDLKKIIRDQYESLFYSAAGEIINQKTCELLGFKDGIPVLSNAKTKVEVGKPPTNGSINNLGTKQTLMVEVNSKTGEKFINLNGKKLKMVMGSQLPPYLKHSAQVLKVTSASTYNNKTPMKIKIIGGMPHILCRSTLAEKNTCQETDINNFKPNVNTTDNANNIQISHKTVLIKENTTEPAKIPSADKVVAGNSMHIGHRTVDSVNQTGSNLTHRNGRSLIVEPNIILNGDVKSPNGVLKMNPLDLSTVNKADCAKVEVKKVDKSSQTILETTDESVQTEKQEEDDELLKFLNIDFIDYLTSNTPVTAPAKSMSPRAPAVVYNSVQPTKMHSEKLQMFFRDLRSAMHADADGNRPIHVGVLSGDVAFVKRSCSILNALQTSVDIPNHGELTALQLAILNDSDPLIVKILLANGASLDVSDSEGNNIIHLAIEWKRTKMLDTLLRFADERNFNLDDFNAEGLTPLMMCCCNNLVDCAELLLKFDADVNVRDRKSGRTALFHAAENHNFDMVQLLLNYNADTKIKNFFGTSPHDAMYEVEEIPENVKSLILGRNAKRKVVEEPKVLKVRRIEENMNKLKTYARFKKIDSYEFPVNIAAKAK